MNWIKWCIIISSFLVLVNGSLEGFFKSSRGLKQGDPLSPYLFVLGMEVLSILIDKVVAEGYLFGYKLVNRSGEVMQFTHLLFADDTLVFCRDSKEQMAHLSWFLLWFEALSGLNINLEKSYVLCLPTTYLGLPLGMRRNSTYVWDGVEERFKKKLAIWKRQYISKWGKLTLIRSTLSNLLIYIMTLLLYF